MAGAAQYGKSKRQDSFQDVRLVHIENVASNNLADIDKGQAVGFGRNSGGAVAVLNKAGMPIGFLENGTDASEAVSEWIGKGMTVKAVINRLDLSKNPMLISLDIYLFDAKASAEEPNVVFPGGMVLCPECGTENRRGANCCVKCGERLPGSTCHCPRCGREFVGEVEFCDNCGEETLPGPSPAKASAPHVNNHIRYATLTSPSSRLIASILCFFFGVFGVHRFYVGKIGTGILWLCTFGLFGIGYLTDLIMILCGGFRDKAGLKLLKWE